MANVMTNSDPQQYVAERWAQISKIGQKVSLDIGKPNPALVH
jgi:hypothetical protein